ncbi:hypothetical protein [Aliikangiella sp. IMCC44359]|uniref:hypothetical protein n=1 Tax=Aliikangiella sp. IMCC44359 TaxID=3459125 RepID=UPI00403A7FCA
MFRRSLSIILIVLISVQQAYSFANASCQMTTHDDMAAHHGMSNMPEVTENCCESDISCFKATCSVTAGYSMFANEVNSFSIMNMKSSTVTLPLFSLKLSLSSRLFRPPIYE